MSFAPTSQIRGSHVMIALGSFFGAMLLANAIFIYLAVSTFDGTEKNAYEKGINYNDRIEAGRAQEALGWRHRVTLAADGMVALAITGPEGMPLRSLTVEGDISRPAAQRFSQPLTFTEAEDGRYRAATAGLDSGNWIVTLTARKGASGGAQAEYNVKERLWLAPRQ